jgi:hypothetical protein
MGPLDALMHLGNLFLPGVALGALAAALAKLLWRRELAPVSFQRLAVPAALAFGRDGKMATYAGMVLACALTLWWRGFGPGRR